MKTNTIKIIAIGDSITYGYPYESALSWFNMAAERLNLEHINRGINGDTTDGMLCRFERDVLRYKPSHVIIMGGTNDAYAGVSADQVINNIRDMVKLALKNGIVTVIGLPIPCNDREEEKLLEQYSEGLRYNAVNNNIEVIDFHKVMRDNSGIRIRDELYCDDVHPNKAGYEVMADVATKALQNIIDEWKQ